jgi:hypothetical protein
MIMRKKKSLLLLAALLLACGSKDTGKQIEQAKQDSITIQTAKKAYVYGLPLVLMDITRRQMTDASSKGMKAATNTFSHLSVFPDASFNVVRPNVDTYYSSAWIDLSKEPLVLSLPDTHDRYYMMPMLDAYSDIFASPGTRTTGNGKGDFLLTGPGWKREVPEGMMQIAAPTNTVWINGRTQVNSDIDGEQIVVPLQKQYKLTPLSFWGKDYTLPPLKSDPSTPQGFQNVIIEQMPADEYFNYVKRLLAAYPVPRDTELLDRFSTKGVGAGMVFDLSCFSDTVKTAIKNLSSEIPAMFKQELATQQQLENGWAISRTGVGAYGSDYRQRAYVAYIGLGANIPEDAIYPMCSEDEEGKPLNGANRYVIRYEKEQTPPTNAFWSLSLYDSDGRFVDNPLKRYAVGDRSNLKTNPDGSTDIYIQHNSPGKDRESNWIPAPTGDFNLCLRVYYPKQAMMNGSWKIAPVKKVN